MKTSFVIIIMITVGILGFIIGYSMAPTDVAKVRHAVSQKAVPASGGEAASGGYGAESGSSGGYGAAASGGYGAAPAASGGYGAAPAPSGGYGAAPAPVSGGYGAAPAPVSGGYGAPPPTGGYGQ